MVVPLSLMWACSTANVESVKAMNEGVAYARQGIPNRAVKSLKRATEIDPSNSLAFYNLAQVHMDAQRWPEAKDALVQAVTIDPEQARYHKALGSTYMELGELESALQSFRRTLDLDPKRFRTRYRLARVHERLGQDGDALKEYTQCIKDAPRLLEAYAQLGMLYTNLDFIKEALMVYRAGQTASLPSTHEQARFQYLEGTVHQGQDDWAAAIKAYNAAVASDPKNGRIIFALATAHQQQGNTVEEKKYLERLSEADSTDLPAHYVSAANKRLTEINKLAEGQ